MRYSKYVIKEAIKQMNDINSAIGGKNALAC